MNELTVQQELDVKVDHLTDVLFEMPQAECPVTHRFGPGVYIREVTIPSGTVVVGHYHNKAHMNVMVSGRAIFVKDDGTLVEMVAPQTFTSQPGRKVVYVLETMTFQNIYPTDETDVDVLEKQLLRIPQTLQDKIDTRRLLLAFERGEDLDDYNEMLREFGMDATAVRKVAEYDGDMIPFPMGTYKVKVDTSYIEGKGLFATGNIKDEEVIAPSRIGNCRTPAGRYANHAKYPNAYMRLKDNGDMELVALRDIFGMHGGDLGEEITVNYRQVLNLNKELICQLQSLHQ
jgi:hypothetical protein